ncbi:endolytic transglycosylase MltG [Paenibacillus wynnii]|uniref:Aminodeoxychorismate lyase n=1 Tax=Paenibacillus wynnii TaxID=268407 RepID=A0A098M632_9BACL|nr:endolytic transglycosylase MltG [Paenibacillus wynnii]KGE17498.1 hypothetical protein PWYN_23120 [Paenibacillus wynnii]
MIKNRSFMLGLGFGLLSGAILLQLMITAGTAQLTKEQVIKEAAELNLKVIAESDKLLTKEEWAALEEQVVKPGGNKPSPSPVVEPKAANSPDDTVAPSAPSTPKQSEVIQPDTSTIPVSTIAPVESNSLGKSAVSVRIPNGITLSEVADLLSKNGVIQDKQEFLRAAVKRGATKVIQYGNYTFDTKESLETIIDKLITVK